MTDLTARRRRFIDLYESGEFDTLLLEAKNLLAAGPIDETSPEDAEVWGDCSRFAMLACAEMKDLAQADVWLVHSLVAAFRAQSVNLMVSLLIPFIIRSYALWRQPRRGLEIADLAQTLLVRLDSERVPRPRLLKRLIHEKRAFLLLKEGDFERARKEYEMAAGFETHYSRGWYKVRLGLLLATYLTDPSSPAAVAAAEETGQLIAELSRGQDGAGAPMPVYSPLVDRAQHNLAYYRQEADDWVAYEIV